MSVIIAKNQTGLDLDLSEIPVPNNAIPASGQVTLTDYASISEVQSDQQLKSHVSAGNVVLNITGEDLSPEDALDLFSPPACIVYGTKYQSDTNTTYRSTTGTSFFEAHKFATTNLPPGKYRIEWTYIWSYNDSGRNFNCRETIDDSINLYEQADGGNGSYNVHQQEPKDRDGSGDGGTDQRHVTSSWADITFSNAGTHEIDIDISSGGAAVIASIHRSSIAIYRVS